jgi:type I restriction enzyme R subunit
METFADFNFADLNIDSQTFENYKSKYLDLYDKVKSDNAKEKTSILNDVDFELDLIHRDEINVDYILRLLQGLAGKDSRELEKRKQEISNILNSTPELRSKRELIEKFIAENLPKIQDSHDVPAQFDKFWNAAQTQAFDALCIDEKINPERLEHLLAQYLYTQRKPLNDDIINLLETKPKLLERPRKLESLWNKITKFIQVFHDGNV